MTAFVAFVRAYAIWIYLLCLFGILIAFKSLLDARRLARTTLFSLEQERATEQSFRAILLLTGLMLTILVATAVNVFVVPPQDSPVLRAPTPTLSAIFFPSNTPPPTLTPTSPKPTETVFITSTPVTATATRVIKPSFTPAQTATATPPLPALVLEAPPNGNVFTGAGQANAAITFRWRWNCEQCTLGPDDRFVVVITYTDKSGKPTTIGGGTKNNFLGMGDIIRGAGIDVWHQAKDDAYQWYVQVKHGEQPVTPPSDAWKFVWN